MKRRAILVIVILLGLASLSYAQAPVPFINLPLVPDATPPGGPQFTLTVNGTGFVSNSVVNWNGAPLATQFVSQSSADGDRACRRHRHGEHRLGDGRQSGAWRGMSSTAFFPVTASTTAVAFSLASFLPKKAVWWEAWSLIVLATKRA